MLYVYPLTTKKEVVNLYARVKIGTIRSNQFSLDVKILLNEWNTKTKKISNVGVQNYVDKIAKQLDLIYKGAYKAIEMVTVEVVEQMKEDLLAVLKGESTTKKVVAPAKVALTLHQAIEGYIENLKKRKIEESSIFEMTKRILRVKKFIPNSLLVKDITHETLDTLFYDMSIDGYRHNTIHNSLLALNQLMEGLEENEVIKRNPLKKYNSSYKSAELAENINYLTEEELTLLYSSYDRFAEKHYQLALDLFFFQYETGLSYTDTQNFDYQKHTIKKGEKTYIVKIRNKNRNRKKKTYQKSLITTKAMEILVKYSYKLPSISRSNYNHYLKSIAIRLGIKHFSSHVARKSLATHLLNRGKNPTAIKMILGHSPNSNMIYQHYAHPDIELLNGLQEE